MRRFLTKYPLHTFLFPVYIILYLFIQNYSLLNASMILWVLGVSILFSGTLFVCSFLFFSDKRKASVFSTFFLIALFTYGYVTDIVESLYFKGLWPFSSVHRYLLITYLVIFTVLFIFIKKTKKTFSDFNLYLNSFCLVLLLISSVNILIQNNKGKNSVLSDCNNNYAINHKINVATEKKPDIYYIILDGYGRQDQLKKHYNFDNSYFIDFLKAKGFLICDSSFSNYPATQQSLSSSLNMNYFDSLTNDCNNKSVGNVYIKQNVVISSLKKAGYTIVHLKSGYSITAKIDSADIVLTPGGLNEFERTFFNLTILRLDEIFGFFLHHRISKQLELIKEIPAIESPKFTFIHIVCPHPPYIFKRDGSFKMRSRVGGNKWWEPRNDYREQTEFISDKAIDFVDHILKTSKTQPIIILQADHGPYIENNDKKAIYDCRKSILNAYLVPDTLRSKFYPSISPVNSFRVLFNGLFNTNLPILADQPPNWEKFVNDITVKNYQKNSKENTHVH